MKNFFIKCVLVTLFIALCSHELFLKTENYFLKENTKTQLYLYNGTFDESENTITRDRIISPKIFGPDYNYTPISKDYFDKDLATYLHFKTGNTGTYVAGISTKSRDIELNAKKFLDYLKHEGLDQIIADRENKNLSNKPAKEKYSKHVKAILQVGNKRTNDFSKPLNYPIEFIPLVNPYSLAVGNTISFQLFYLGKPLANQTVHVSSRMNNDTKSGTEKALKTDAEGKVSFQLTNSGFWYIATIYMFETKEANLDYESNWATLTFQVKE